MSDDAKPFSADEVAEIKRRANALASIDGSDLRALDAASEEFDRVCPDVDGVLSLIATIAARDATIARLTADAKRPKLDREKVMTAVFRAEDEYERQWATTKREYTGFMADKIVDAYESGALAQGGGDG